jgi:hypothetical protein
MAATYPDHTVYKIAYAGTALIEGLDDYLKFPLFTAKAVAGVTEADLGALRL